MRKTILILLLIVSVLVNTLIPVNKAEAAAPVLARVVAGSVGERVIVGIAEKAGVKFVSKTARKKAVERWNLEVYEKIKYYDEVGETYKAEELRRFQQTMSSATTADIIPLTNSTNNMGKFLVDSAMFLTGADVIYEVYKDIETAHNEQKMLEIMADVANGIATGQIQTSALGWTGYFDPGTQWYNFGVPSKPDDYSYFYGLENANYWDIYKPFWTEILKTTFDEANNAYFVQIMAVGFTSLGTRREQVYSNLRIPVYTITEDFNRSAFVPDISNVPEVTPLEWLQSYVDNRKVPEFMPQELEVNIPMDDNYPEELPAPWNEPDTFANPSTDPVPPPVEPTPEKPPTTNPDAPWWEWLLSPLEKLLEWLKYLIDLLKHWFTQLLNYLKDIIQWLAGLLSGIIAFLTPLWTWLSDILNAILQIPELIGNLLKTLFVPAEGYFSNFFNDIKLVWDSKIPIIGQLSDFMTAIEQTSLATARPVIEVDLPERYGGVTISVIDFSYFDKYRNWILNFIRFTAWFVFLKRLWARLPRVIGG